MRLGSFFGCRTQQVLVEKWNSGYREGKAALRVITWLTQWTLWVRPLQKPGESVEYIPHMSGVVPHTSNSAHVYVRARDWVFITELPSATS